MGGGGWRSVESARLTPLWPGSIHGACVTRWLSFSLVLFLALRGFSLGPPVSSLHKNQHFEFQSNLETLDKKSQFMECPLLSYLIPSLSLLLLFLYFPFFRFLMFSHALLFLSLKFLNFYRLFSSILVLRFG